MNRLPWLMSYICPEDLQVLIQVWRGHCIQRIQPDRMHRYLINMDEKINAELMVLDPDRRYHGYTFGPHHAILCRLIYTRHGYFQHVKTTTAKI
jgi:hypothetical protein